MKRASKMKGQGAIGAPSMGTTDYAYGNTDAYLGLTAEQSLENADSYAMFCMQHLGDRVKAEEEEQQRRAQEAAKTHGEEVWAAWDAGRIAVGRDGFTTSGGVDLPIGIVKGIVMERFPARYPARYEEIVRHLQAEPMAYRSVRCGDGYLAPEELVRAVDEEEAR